MTLLALLAVAMVGGLPADIRPGVQMDGKWLDSSDAEKIGLVVTETREGDFYRVKMENRSGKDVRLDEIGWRRYGKDALSVTGLKAWVEGWQMATPCGLRTAADCDFDFNPDYLPFAVNEPRDYVRGEKGRFRAEHMVTFLDEATGKVCLFGFTTGKDRFGHFRMKLGEDGLEALDMLCSCDRAVVPPGAIVTSETLAVMWALSSEVQLARFAEAWSRASEARHRFDPPVGWCSWYYYFSKVKLSDVIENMDWIRTRAATDDDFKKIRYIQLDDGYQSALGDWLVPNEKFPGGVKRFAGEAKARGFLPALWVGPFMAEENSALLREHPDWMIHGADGKVIYPFNWREGHKVAVLDGTHPGVLAHLEELFRTLRNLGIEYVKLDFCMLGAASFGGILHDPAATRAQALRRAYEAIRRGFGDDGFILACTTPFGPAVGIADAMRSSTDITPYWEPDHAFHDEAPTVPNVCRNVIGHNYMNGKLWINDPDTLIVRDDSTKLTESEVTLWEKAVELAGGSLMLSDRFSTLSPERMPLVKTALTGINRTRAFPADRWAHTVPSVWGTAAGDWTFDFKKHEVSANSSPLRFIAFNIWGDYFGNPPHERDMTQASVLSRYAPDIIALQEVTPNYWKSRLFTELDKKGYATIRTNERDAIRRAGGLGAEGFVNHVPLLYRRDRLELVASGYDIFHLELTDNKGITWAVLEDKIDGRRLIAFSTHFWYQQNGAESDAIRELNARACVELFGKIKVLYGDLPVIGGGDFNVFRTFASTAHDTFRRHGYVRADAVAAKRSECSSWHGNPVRDANGIYRGARKPKDDSRFYSLDHVFVEAAKIDVREQRVILEQDALDVSDHSPVMVDFTLK